MKCSLYVSRPGPKTPLLFNLDAEALIYKALSESYNRQRDTKQGCAGEEPARSASLVEDFQNSRAGQEFSSG